MKAHFSKPKNYCKYWKACADFKRSQCDDSEMFVEGCRKYKEREDAERKTKK